MEDVSTSEIMTSSSMGAYANASSSSGSHYSTALTESIEESTVHWSILSQEDSELTDDQIAASNFEVYESLLRSHPEWGRFFIPFMKDGIFEVHDKFAEGAQAEIFNASMKRVDRDGGRLKSVLKVFKKGILLQHLQSQWPHGYLQWMGKSKNSLKDGTIHWIRHVAIVWKGMLLPTGQFAFLMRNEDGDLRNLIVRRKSHCSHGCGPFRKEVFESFLYQIAAGMDWLHKHNIIHRDLKASNVLVSNACHVADFECSIGVVGTGFWRDPQILQACIERNTSQRPELFTRAADVYSYGMTCYEIFTGKIPFEGEAMTMDLVVKGHRPEVPEFIDDWMKDLLYKCWEANRDARPSFEDILNIIVANTTIPFIRSQHVWRLKFNNDEIRPLFGCDKLSHGIEMMERSPYESGTYVCKHCLKGGHGVVYHCNSCGDFDLHPGCANIPTEIESFLHPHSMYLQLGFEQKGERLICNACHLDIGQSNYYSSYRCFDVKCTFNLHIQCAKYARTISHQLHEEHELELIHYFTFVGVEEGSQVCSGCKIKLDHFEIVYSCRECGFSIHPYCIIGKLECKSW